MSGPEVHEPIYRKTTDAGPEGVRVYHTWDCNCGARTVWHESRGRAETLFREHLEDAGVCGCGAEDREPCRCSERAAA